jgi:hypothetical protein
MPATCEIDHAARIVRSRAWGTLVDSDLQATQRALREDPRFEPTYSQIYDFSEVEHVRITGKGLESLARSSPFARNARRAVIVGSDHGYGMARMFAMLSDRDPSTFRIFRDTASASAWIETDAEG